MLLRDAELADLETLQWWDEQAHIIEAGGSGSPKYNWARELKRKPEWRQQLIAEQDGEAIAFVQIVDPVADPSQYWGKEVNRRMRAIEIWIGETYNLNRGYGSTIMNMVLERCFDDDIVNEILVDPLSTNQKAHRFYTRLGFKYLETKTLAGDLCYVMKLKRSNYFGD